MKKAFLILSVLGIIICGMNIYTHAEDNPHLNKGEELLKEKKYEQAIDEFKRGLGTDNKDDKKGLLFQIGYSYMMLFKFNEAAEYFKDSLKIDPGYLYAIETLGMLYFCGLKDYEKGIEYFLKAERLDSIYTPIYYNMARYYSLKNDKQKAFKYLDVTLCCGYRQLESIKSDADFANIRSDARFINLVNNFNYILEGDECYNLVVMYIPGVDNNSIRLYQKAVEKYSKALWPGSITLGSLYNKLGKVYNQKGDYDNAEAYHEKALKISLEVLGEKHPNEAGIYSHLGSVYKNKGDYDRAITYYEKALDIRREVFGENHPDTAGSYNNLGVVYSSKGDYDRAIGYYEKALKLTLEIFGEKHFKTAGSYNNLGVVYSSKGDYDRAIMYFEKTLKIYRNIFGENHPDTAASYNDLGSAYDSKGDYDIAIRYYYYAQIISLGLLSEEDSNATRFYNNLRSGCWNKGNYNKANEYYIQALSIINEAKADQNIILYSQNLGKAYINATIYIDACKEFFIGIKTIEKVRKRNLSGSTDFTSRNINSFYYAANACFLDKNMNSMFNISERMRAMGCLERLSLKAAIEAGGIDPEQGRELLKLKDDIERLSVFRHKLISMEVYKMSEEQKKERDRQLEQVSQEIVQAEIEFTILDSEFMKNEEYRSLRDASVVSVNDAQKLCGKNSAIVEYILPEKPDKYMKPYAIIITGSSINSVELDSKYNFSERIDKYRTAISDNKQNDIDILSRELYNKLIEPLNSYINSKKIKKLMIVPDGSLAFLPFDSLKTKDNKYLSERYELNLTPSVTVSVMTQNRKFAKKDNLMAFGGGLYSATGESKTRGDRSFRGMAIASKQKEKLAAKAYNTPLEYYNAQKLYWSDLPGTEKEVSAINDKIYNKKNTELYTGSKVSEKNLKSLSKEGKLKQYSSIHLACHGYYDPEYPAYSAVVFSEVSGKLKESKDDGYMSVEETALLNLQSDIVVLSACETGLGKMVSGDGVIGLTRAFQVAGSNRVLVTLWPVSDEATEAFMVSFYKKVKAGMSYSQALVKVKEEFRNSSKGGAGIADYSAPYYWAGFVLYE